MSLPLPAWWQSIQDEPEAFSDHGGHLSPEGARRSVARWNDVLYGRMSATSAADEEDEDY